MHSLLDIRRLLGELDEQPTDDLEGQDLDFKEWSRRGMAEAVASVVEMAICMANGGGGTVVFGVQEHVVGRAKAIVGVPVEVDVNRLVKAVYDSSDPKLTPVFEDLRVPEGTGRLLVMHVYSGLPPYTDTAGRGKIRIGKDCQPLTGTLRRRIMVETGETDYTSTEVPGNPKAQLSAAAMERLRDAARHERAPEELLRKGDIDLLETLGAIHHGKFTRAGLLLAGKEAAIQEHLPAFVWTHLRMQSDTRYTDRMDGRDPLPVALFRLLDRIMADNPISTLEHGMFHFEYRAYPEIALREAMLNALSHADFRLGGPILIKQYPGKLEISNPGGFIGGISPENILHHPPAPRNPRLVEALARLRLVNRSNLGIGRMFEAMLIEGKEPPLIQQQGDSVTVTFLRREPSAPFRAFVAEESRQGRLLSVDHLLILQHLLRHPEIDTATAARICQRTETEAREVLNDMEQALGYLERGGSGRGTYWTLRPDLHRQLAGPGHPERVRRIDWEAAKTRILSVLRRRAERGEPGVSNSEIRQITHLTRYQVVRLMRELMEETPAVRLSGTRRYARYNYTSGK
jgi:ATP-dependent DNA helicase RecG